MVVAWAQLQELERIVCLYVHTVRTYVPNVISDSSFDALVPNSARNSYCSGITSCLNFSYTQHVLVFQQTKPLRDPHVRLLLTD